MARFFTLSIELTLFGETAVVRSWGRIGRRGREKTEVFSDELAAASHFLELKVKDTPEREARNPATGATIKVAAARKLTFAPAKTLKDVLNK
jgi:predicted DNA-binding WGR domain protein